jgi:hypothetical protein
MLLINKKGKISHRLGLKKTSYHRFSMLKYFLGTATTVRGRQAAYLYNLRQGLPPPQTTEELARTAGTHPTINPTLTERTEGRNLFCFRAKTPPIPPRSPSPPSPMASYYDGRGRGQWFAVAGAAAGMFPPGRGVVGGERPSTLAQVMASRAPEPWMVRWDAVRAAEAAAREVALRVHPTQKAERRRQDVVDYLRRLIGSTFGFEVPPPFSPLSPTRLLGRRPPRVSVFRGGKKKRTFF